MSHRLFLLLCGSSLAAAIPSPATLDAAIRTAWANDPAVAALSLAPALDRAREEQAGLRPPPELDLRAGLPLRGDSEWSVGVGLSQPLPRADKVALARAQARLGGESAPFELRERQRLVASEVRRLWYDLAVQQARLTAARRTAAELRQFAAALQDRRAAGEVADADWDLLQGELTRATQTLLVAEAEVTGAQARLHHRLRLAPEAPASAGETLEALLDRPLPAPDASAATRPELALAELAVRRADAAVALARAQSRGDWTVGAGLDYERRTNDATGRLEHEPRLSVGASAPWPTQRPPNRGEIREREAGRQLAEANLEARRAEIAAECGAALAAARACRPVVLQYRPLLAAAAELPRRLTAAAARGEVSSFHLAQARQQRATLEADFHAAAARYLTLLADAETAAGLVPSPA
ncbi:MAG: TolC family protein [Opitutaceae bacterium]